MSQELPAAPRGYPAEDNVGMTVVPTALLSHRAKLGRDQFGRPTGLTLTETGLLLVLMSYEQAGEWPAREELAAAGGVSLPRLQIYLNGLVAKGVLALDADPFRFTLEPLYRQLEAVLAEERR